ncbi:MAG: helix-turn-helix transcriptional regulator [Hyphomicrobiaceae bacterium]
MSIQIPEEALGAFISEVATATSASEVVDQFVRFLARRGYDQAIIKSIDLDQGAVNQDLFCNFPKRQIELCARLQAAGEHPVMSHVTHTMLPFFVRDLPDALRKTDLQKEYWQAFACDLDNALVLPIYISKELRGIVLVAGEAADTSLEAVHEIHAAVFYVVGRWLKLRRASDDKSESVALDATLSKRERECLILAARGLSEKQIARTLLISPNTVRIHATNANKKLLARSKSHAIAIAIANGQIPLDDLQPSEFDVGARESIV